MTGNKRSIPRSASRERQSRPRGASSAVRRHIQKGVCPAGRPGSGHAGCLKTLETAVLALARPPHSCRGKEHRGERQGKCVGCGTETAVRSGLPAYPCLQRVWWGPPGDQVQHGTAPPTASGSCDGKGWHTSSRWGRKTLRGTRTAILGTVISELNFANVYVTYEYWVKGYGVCGAGLGYQGIMTSY